MQQKVPQTAISATNEDEIAEREERLSNQIDGIQKHKIEGQQNNGKRRIGIIGFGHLGQFLKMELTKSTEFELKRIWNRTEDANEGVLPLSDLNASNLFDVDLVIEVAHPDIIHNYAKIILKHADLFISSLTSMADERTNKEIQELIQIHRNRSVFIPCITLWAAKDIRKMADLRILQGLTIQYMTHPNSLRLPELNANASENTPELVVLHNLSADSKRTNHPKVLYDGPARQLCKLLPNDLVSLPVASAAIAATNLGFDNTRVKIVVDPELRNWQVIEYEVLGENGLRTIVRRENPTQPGASSGSLPYFEFFSSIKETLHQHSFGLNIF